MQINLRSKKMKAIVGEGLTVIIIVALGLGLGFRFTKWWWSIKIYNFGNEYTEAELVNDGVTNNGVTYEFKKKDDGLYVVLPSSTTFSTTSVMLQDTNFGRDILAGGDNPQPLAGENNFFNIDYAGIGVVKVTNDGYVHGGYYLNASNEPTLRPGLSQPLEYARITENRDALISLIRVFGLERKIQEDGSVSSTYVLNDEPQNILMALRVFAYRKGSQAIMGVAVHPSPNLVLQIGYDIGSATPDKVFEQWPNTDGGEPYWGKDEKPEILASENHPDIEFKYGDLVNADGSPATVTWNAINPPNARKEVDVSELFYKVHITGRKINVPLLSKKIQIKWDGSFEFGSQTFQIASNEDTFTLSNELEVKLERSN